MSEPASRQRLDKWLWHARFGRTRTRSAALVRAGFVRLNGAREREPDRLVGPGDILTIAMPGRTYVIRVLALTEARRDATAAARLYEPVADQGISPA